VDRWIRDFASLASLFEGLSFFSPNVLKRFVVSFVVFELTILGVSLGPSAI
jgi:hypothetical protein